MTRFFVITIFFRSSDFFAVALVWNSKDRLRDKTPTAEHVCLESEVFYEIEASCVTDIVVLPIGHHNTSA